MTPRQHYTTVCNEIALPLSHTAGKGTTATTTVTTNAGEASAAWKEGYRERPSSRPFVFGTSRLGTCALARTSRHGTCALARTSGPSTGAPPCGTQLIYC
eukprot:scaffold6448_cov124-Isochrysis_galbana.AAC.3